MGTGLGASPEARLTPFYRSLLPFFLFVFLLLAALYESWSVPFAVMLVVPLGVIGSVAAVTLRGMPNDVYFTVGLIAIVGLSAKNAILIIEFAKDLMAEGKTMYEATVEAALEMLDGTSRHQPALAVLADTGGRRAVPEAALDVRDEKQLQHHQGPSC